MNDPESCLRNLYTAFLFRTRKDSLSKLSHIDKMRWLGGMEALLQCLGKLPSGIPFATQKIQKKFFFFPYIVEETYEDFILRTTLEFLRTSPNTPLTTFR